MPAPLFKNVCDEQLFSKLYEQYSKDLHDFIYYKYGEHFDPEDKVHEAFIKLWKNCKRVAPEKAKSFLFTVINNITLNDIKHKKVVLKHQRSKPKQYTHETPQFIMEETEYLEKYQAALAKLSEGQRVAFLLNRVEGKRHKEIAEMLNISRKAVEKRIYTALDKLRQHIEGI
ncbi:MAG: RNA polymerase subunit sigma-70 [Flavobacterium sp.]|nr:MAG: RNA polymerase subunit sigma-70 [Flavobacterium sp.]